MCFLFVVAALSFSCREGSDFPSAIAFKFDLPFSHYAETLWDLLVSMHIQERGLAFSCSFNINWTYINFHHNAHSHWWGICSQQKPIQIFKKLVLESFPRLIALIKINKKNQMY
jgi:hypothetical protein